MYHIAVGNTERTTDSQTRALTRVALHATKQRSKSARNYARDEFWGAGAGEERWIVYSCRGEEEEEEEERGRVCSAAFG